MAAVRERQGDAKEDRSEGAVGRDRETQWRDRETADAKGRKTQNSRRTQHTGKQKKGNR